jgi:hypothetical protein
MYKGGSYDCLDQYDTLGVQHLNDILRISLILSHDNLFLLATIDLGIITIPGRIIWKMTQLKLSKTTLA